MDALKTRFLTLNILIFISLTAAFGSNQGKYWIHFKEFARGNPVQLSAKAIQRRHMRGTTIEQTRLDYYPDKQYLSQIVALGIEIRQVSRWINAASVYCDSIQLMTVSALSFVDSITPVASYKGKRLFPSEKPPPDIPLRADSIDYGLSYRQLHLSQIDSVHQLGYSGKSILIGIMDTGFNLAHPFLNSIQSEGRLIATYDFINNDRDVQDSPDIQQSHGTTVWSVIGANAPTTMFGSAYNADFVLAKTEIDTEEIRQEEDNWIAAAEWMDSLGVDIICSALGYIDWYDTSQLDGHTCFITIAAEAAAASGIAVANVAGNERNNFSWRRIIPPSDGDSVIAVGAVSPNGSVTIFSSPGPTTDGRIKPDIMAQGIQVIGANYANGSGQYYDGTSVATPIVAGGLALALEAHPSWSLDKLFTALRQSGSMNSAPNNDYGWGIAKIFNLIAINGYFSISQSTSTPFNGDTIRLFIAIYDSLGQPGGNHQFDIQVISGNAELIGLPVSGGPDTLIQNVFIPLPGLQKLLIRDNIAEMDRLTEIDASSKTNISLEIWPNPAIDSVTFVFEAENQSWSEIIIFTVSGDKVARLRLNSTLKFNTLNWPALNDNGDKIASGVYIAQLRTATGSKSAKFAYIKN
jgi:serine protease AprX